MDIKEGGGGCGTGEYVDGPLVRLQYAEVLFFFSLENEQVNIKGSRHKFGALFSELFPFLFKNTG